MRIWKGRGGTPKNIGGTVLLLESSKYPDEYFFPLAQLVESEHILLLKLLLVLAALFSDCIML